MIDIEKTGKLIFDLLKERFGSIKNAAAWLCITETSIYQWRSNSKIPSIDNMIMIADLLGMKVDDLIVRKEGVENGITLHKVVKEGR